MAELHVGVQRKWNTEFIMILSRDQKTNNNKATWDTHHYHRVLPMLSYACS